MMLGQTGGGDHDAGVGGDGVEGWVVGVGAVLREALQAGIDDLRVDLPARLIGQPQVVHGAGPHILHDDVAFGHQAPEQIQALRGLGVAGDGLFVHVHHQKAVAVHARIGLGITAQFPLHRALHLEYVGPQPSQGLGAHSAGLKLGHIQNAVTGKRSSASHSKYLLYYNTVFCICEHIHMNQFIFYWG